MILLGLFGGTFDPIHNGHLSVAHELLKRLPLEQIQLIPCRYPPHGKHPKASIADRIAMIKLAIADEPHLVINTIEAEREDISYTTDTLKLCKQLFPNKSLCLILATDVFLHLNEWHEWRNVLNYCHIIIVDRPKFSLSKEKWMIELLVEHKAENSEDLNRFPNGKILFQQPSPSIITATEIRQLLAEGHYDAIAAMLPKSVLDYIKTHKLYRALKL